MTLRTAQLQSRRRFVPDVAFRSRRIPILLRAAFLLFIFTIPLESLNVAFELGPVSLARFAGLLLFALSLVYHSRCYAVIPKAMLWFSAYLAVYVMAGGFIRERYTPLFAAELLTLIQLVTFFWIATNLLRNGLFAKKALIIYGLSVAALSIGVMFGLPGFSQTTLSETTGDRLTAIGYDPNYFGLVLALAAITLIGVMLNKDLRAGPLKVVFFPLLLIVLAFMIQTGSRSASAACAFALLFFARSLSFPRRNLLTAMLVIAALFVGSYLLLNNRDTMARWAQTIYEGDTAGRDRIFSGAVAMISERPLLGWGPVQYRYELNARYDGTEGARDAHNLILNLLLEVGLFGTTLFMFGVFACLRAAWKSRKGRLGSTPLALLMVLAIFLQFQPWMTSKPFWFVLALAVGAAGGMQRYPVRLRSRAPFSRRGASAPAPSVAFAFHLAGNPVPQRRTSLQQRPQPLYSAKENSNVWNRRPLSP